MEEESLYQTDNPMPERLPNSQGALILGIISIFTFCCCYGLIGLICGIIAVVLANKAVSLYETNPESYSEKSLSNAKAGKVCGLIGIILSAILVIVVIVMLSTGAYQEMLNEILEELRNEGFDF